jgi:hypothetical protein
VAWFGAWWSQSPDDGAELDRGRAGGAPGGGAWSYGRGSRGRGGGG